MQGAPENSSEFDLQKRVERELEELALVNTFGAAAVFGPGIVPMSTLRKLRTLGNLKRAWDLKDAQENQAQWAEDHPEADGLIQWAIVQAEKEAASDVETEIDP